MQQRVLIVNLLAASIFHVSVPQHYLMECTIGHDGEWIMFEIDSYLLELSEITPLSRTPTVHRRLFSKVLITPIDPARQCIVRFTQCHLDSSF
jgi:hypothetical protein